MFKKFMMLLMSASIALASFTGLAGCGPSRDKVLKIYNWDDYFDFDILTAFKKETGYKVVYDFFDYSEDVEREIKNGTD